MSFLPKLIVSTVTYLFDAEDMLVVKEFTASAI
jgi:hypothetical protein